MTLETMAVFPVRDAYLSEENPDFKYGGRTYIAVGNYAEGRRYTGVLIFTLPEAPYSEAQIVEIKLHLYFYDTIGAGSDYIEAHELLEDFSEEDATWNERDSGVNWSTPGALPPGSASPTVIDRISISDAECPVWKTLVLKGDGAENPVDWGWGETRGVMLTTSGELGAALNYMFVSKDATASDPFAEADQYRAYLEIVYGYDETPPVISNVAVTDVGSDHATITWETDEPATSVVRYGRSSGNYTEEMSDGTRVTSHSIKIYGLIPNTTYYFVVESTDIFGNTAQSSEYTFTTLERSETHPGLFFESIEEAPGWRYGTQGIEPYATWHSSIPSYAERNLLGRDFSDPAYREIYKARDAKWLALSYQITKDSAFAEKTREALLYIGNSDDYKSSALSTAWALADYVIAYDYVADYILENYPEDDIAIRNKIAETADWLYSEYLNGLVPDDSVTVASALGLTALCLSDYDSPYESGPAEWFHAATVYLFEEDWRGRAAINGLYNYGGLVRGIEGYSGMWMPYLTEWLYAYNHRYGSVFDDFPFAKEVYNIYVKTTLPDGRRPNLGVQGNVYRDVDYSFLALGLLPEKDASWHKYLTELYGKEYSTDSRMGYVLYDKYRVAASEPDFTTWISEAGECAVFRKDWSFCLLYTSPSPRDRG